MKIPLSKAIWTLFWTTCVVCGTAGMGLAYYHNYKWRRAHDDKNRLVAIVQTCPAKESLKTAYLAELLDLSIDQPVNLYAFSLQAAKRTLLASPLIKEAELAKIYPGTLHVDYTLRSPIAFLTDFSNTALDTEGTPIPFKPFFTPKRLPDIYLGLNGTGIENPWGKKIDDARVAVAMTLLEFVNGNLVNSRCRIRKIDVSRAFAPSFGQREVIVVLEQLVEKQKQPALVVAQRVLRINRDNYKQELSRFKALQAHLGEESVVIDLRIPQLAFIKIESVEKL